MGNFQKQLALSWKARIKYDMLNILKEIIAKVLGSEGFY